MNGSIMQVSGSVIDVRFEEGQLPKIDDALTVDLDGKKLVMEVAQHNGKPFFQLICSFIGKCKGQYPIWFITIFFCL